VLLDGTVMLFEDPQNRFTEVLQDVPAIGDLSRLRHALAGTIGITRRPIPADDFNAWVIGEPVRDCLGARVRASCV
jgi:hypothetical protein